jgi:hypothetical protein
VKTEDKIKILIGIMASSQYRVWWWANYKTQEAKAEFERLWGSVLSRLTPWEIRDGMARWQEDHAEDCPPSPELFADFMRPKHTVSSRSGFADIRSALNAGGGHAENNV